MARKKWGRTFWLIVMLSMVLTTYGVGVYKKYYYGRITREIHAKHAERKSNKETTKENSSGYSPQQ